eukprot:231448_1
MFIVLFFVGLVSIASAASKVEGSWVDCGGDNAVGNVSTVIFNDGKPIPVNQNFTVVGVGYINEDCTAPSYEMKITDGIFVNEDLKGDGCKPLVYNFPLHAGSLYYEPVQCPVKKGPMNITFISYISSSAPDGTAVTKTTIYDQANQGGNAVVCTSVSLKMTN